MEMKEVTAIVVYGNRDYGIALYNMVNCCLKKGSELLPLGHLLVSIHTQISCLLQWDDLMCLTLKMHVNLGLKVCKFQNG